MVTDEMVEKAARAICAVKELNPDCNHQINVFDGKEPYDSEDDRGRRYVFGWRLQEKFARSALEAALSAAEPQPAPSVTVKAGDAAAKLQRALDAASPNHKTMWVYVDDLRAALSAQVQDESEIVNCLLSGKPFVFDPATNFCHADDGGAPEHGIKYVPVAQVQDVAENGLTLSALQSAHVERQEEWCPDVKPDLSFRGNELGGECGEAQNVIKKLERERHGWRGSRDTVEHLAEELADVIHCSVLVAITAGVDLQQAVIAKFNDTSMKNGLSVMLPAAPAKQEGDRNEAN